MVIKTLGIVLILFGIFGFILIIPYLFMILVNAILGYFGIKTITYAISVLIILLISFIGYWLDRR